MRTLDGGGIDTAVADRVVETAVGIYALPLGIGLNFVVNGRDILVPMAVEEPSVIAAAAKLAEELGGAAKPSGAGGGDVGVAFLTDHGAAETFRQRAAHLGLEILSIRTGASGLRREPSDSERNQGV
jgi:hypothetical protein